MGKIQKKIHSLTIFSLDWNKVTEWRHITYQTHRKAWREYLRQFSKKEILSKTVNELFNPEILFEVESKSVER